MKLARHIAPSAFVWLLLGGALLLHPALRDAPLQPQVEPDRQVLHALTNYSWVIHNGDFWHTLKISFLLALETIVIALSSSCRRSTGCT